MPVKFIVALVMFLLIGSSVVVLNRKLDAIDAE